MARGRRQSGGPPVSQIDYLRFAVRWGLLFSDDERVEPEDVDYLAPDDRFDLELGSESYCELIREAARMLPGSPPIEILENAATIRVRVGAGDGAQEIQVPHPPGKLRQELLTGEEVTQALARHAVEILEVLRAARSARAPGRPSSLGEALAGRPRGA